MHMHIYREIEREEIKCTCDNNTSSNVWYIHEAINFTTL